MTAPDNASPALLCDGPESATHTIVLAHGAGAGMDSEFMNVFALALAAADLRVVRFEFPYMAQRRVTGKRRPPDSEPVLRASWHNVLQSLNAQTVIIGGKSMGGRMASLIADEAQVAGLVCLGYPFHPIGKPDRLRTDHLADINTPTLIAQGERDSMGNRNEVDTYELSEKIGLAWLPDGDHSFKPRKASGRTMQQNWQEAIQAVKQFAKALPNG